MGKIVALVSNTSWSFVKFRMKLLVRLKEAGYRVIVVAPPDEESPAFIANGLTYVPLMKLRQKGRNPWHDYQFYRELQQIYRVWMPDLAIHYTIKPNIYATRAAVRLGIPCVAVVTGLGYTFINGGTLSRITEFLYRNAFKSAKQVWFLNGDDRCVFTEQRHIVSVENTTLLQGEGIDAKIQFNPEGWEAAADRPGDQMKFIFVGRLLRDKGICEYVEAAQRLKVRYPDVTFDILGYLNVENPSSVDAAIMAMWERDGATRYLGPVTDVRPVLIAHDCVVLPSYREGMSTTLMEAAAMGLPLVASDIPGCRELVDNGETGFLCEPKNTDSLVNQLEAVIRLPPSERRAMGKRGRAKMLREFDMDTVIEHYLDVIPKLLRQKVK